MIVLLRHANDEDHEQTFAHDYHVHPAESQKAKRMGKKLRRKYGTPDVIYCSPFRRTITTAELLRGKHTTSILVTKDLGRYFTKSNRRHPDVAPRTLAYGVDVNETKEMFLARVSNFCDSLRHIREDQTIWIVTHAYTFKTIAKYLGHSYNGNIDFLQHHVF